jgi:hypothetical protein
MRARKWEMNLGCCQLSGQGMLGGAFAMDRGGVSMIYTVHAGTLRRCLVFGNEEAPSRSRGLTWCGVTLRHHTERLEMVIQ